MKLVLFFLALLGLASVNALTTSTWTGTASALWTAAANWDSGVPTATTIAIISGSCSSNCVITIPSGTNATCFNLTVALGDTTTGLVIASGGALTTNLAVASDGWINVSGSVYGTLDTNSAGYVALLQGSYVSNLAASDSGQYYVSGTATIGSAALNSFDSFIIENGNLMVNGVFTLAAGEEEPITGSGNLGANITFGKSSYFYLSQDGALESVTVWQWGNAALTSAGSAFSAGGTFYVYEGVVYNLMPGATLYCYDIQYQLDYYSDSDLGNTTFNNWGTIAVMYQLGGDEYGNFAGLDTNDVVLQNGNFTFNNWGYINATNYSTTNTDNTYNTPSYYADSLVGGLHLNYLTFNQLNSTSWDGLLSFYYSDLYFSAASAGPNGVVNNVNSSVYAYSDSNYYTGRSNVMGQAENFVHVLTPLTFNNFFFDDISVLVYTNGTTFNNTNFTNYAAFNTTQSGVVVVNLTGWTGAEEITCDTYDWSGNPYSSLVVHNTRGSTFMAYTVYLLGQCMFVNNGTVTYLAGEYSDTTFYTPATTGVINLPGALFDYSGLVDGTNSDVTLTGTIYSDTASGDPAYLTSGTNWYNFGEFRIGDYFTISDTGMHFWNEGTGLLTSLSTGSYDIATFSFYKLTLDGSLGIRYPDSTTQSLGSYFGSCSSSCSQEIFTWETDAYPNTGSLAPAGMFPGSVTQLSDFGSSSLSTGTSQFLGDASLGLCYNPTDSSTGYAAVAPLLTGCTQAVGTGYIGATGHYGSTDFSLSTLPSYISGYTAASFALGGPAGSGATGGSPPPASTGTSNPPPPASTGTNPPPASSTGSNPPPRTTTAGSTSASTTTGKAPTPATTTSSANVVFTSVFLMIISAFLLFL